MKAPDLPFDDLNTAIDAYAKALRGAYHVRGATALDGGIALVWGKVNGVWSLHVVERDERDEVTTLPLTSAPIHVRLQACQELSSLEAALDRAVERTQDEMVEAIELLTMAAQDLTEAAK